MKLLNYFKIFFLLIFTSSIYANESIDYKVKKLTLELRCMTCQNQSIHDSDSDYSKDIKILVKEKFKDISSEFTSAHAEVLKTINAFGDTKKND